MSSDGLYQFPSAFNKIPSLSFVFVGEHTFPDQWHSHLEHPAFHIVRHVLTRFSLPFSSNKIFHPCSTCFSSKSKQLPFSLSYTQINFPLELIYIDVWGTSPVCSKSKSGSKYYVSFWMPIVVILGFIS